MKDEIHPKSLGTHDGRFHADEVTACALLLIFDLIQKDKIHRTRNSDVLRKCEYVCDVGGTYDAKKKLFDHHQVDYAEDLSSAGMILHYLRDEKIIDEPLFHWLNHELIHIVDAYDNGREIYGPGAATFSHIISNFNCISYESTPEEEDRAFRKALDFAIGHLERLIGRFKYMQSCQKLVKERMEKDEICLFFEQGVPWLESFFELGGEAHPAQFIIMPAGAHWKLRGIPPNFQERMSVRKPLPANWAGLLEEELKIESGIPGAIFCHKGRFISVWETREDAIKALNVVLGEAT